jgi:hypothetical protein
MNLISPNLEMAPGAKVVVNSLYDSKDPRCLTQDLLLVELTAKTFIDVSWFPEHDPSGAYVVSVFRGHEQIHEIETRSAFEAVRFVENLAYEFSMKVGNVSCSREFECEFRIDYSPAI